MNNEKMKAINTALAQLEKDFGKGSVMKLGDKSSLNVLNTTSGSLGLDIALGIGGFPEGRIIEIYGNESSGKTTICLHYLAEIQRKGGIACLIDAEHALDPIYAKALGVDIDNLIVSQPENGEMALDIVEELVRSGAVDAIVIDSVAALVPKAEIEGEMGSSHVGLQARLLSKGLRKITGLAMKSKCTIVFINQIREKIGVMFGSPETTSGGRGLKFFSSVRLEVKRIDSVKAGDKLIGNRTRVKVVKNKVAPPFKQAEFDIMYGKGVSKSGELLDIASDIGVIKKAGPWYSYDDSKLGQGRQNVKDMLEQNPILLGEIECKVRKHFGLNGGSVDVELNTNNKSQEDAGLDLFQMMGI